jgi:hypothetical protein
LSCGGHDWALRCTAQMARDEFGEGLRDPMPRIDVGAKLVMTAVEIWTKACPALITRAERSRFNPRIGRSGDFRRPWSASIGLFAYCSVT